MSQCGEEAGQKALMVRLSVPATGGLRSVASELATKLAVYLGSEAPEAASAGAALEGLAARVAPDGSDGDITFEFTSEPGELLIRARCNGRSSETRYPLPS